MKKNQIFKIGDKLYRIFSIGWGVIHAREIQPHSLRAKTGQAFTHFEHDQVKAGLKEYFRCQMAENMKKRYGIDPNDFDLDINLDMFYKEHTTFKEPVNKIVSRIAEKYGMEEIPTRRAYGL